MGKREFWKRIPYVNCPEPKCKWKYKTKVRLALISHLARLHNYSFAEARDKADATGIYCPKTYRARVKKT
jgi:hypothetical protein